MAWAPDEIDIERWKQRLGSCFTLVAEQESEILGFASLESDGNLDMLYVLADWQSKGVAKLLYASIEAEARRLKLDRIRSDVSITAQPFFLRMGFVVDRHHVKEVRGVTFRNALMSKPIA